MNDVILYFACKYFGEWDKIYDALEKQEQINFGLLNKLKKEYKDQYITVLDNEYPKELKKINM